MDNVVIWKQLFLYRLTGNNLQLIHKMPKTISAELHVADKGGSTLHDQATLQSG